MKSTGTARRRRWTTEKKLRIVDESLQHGMSVSYVARRHGVAANLLFRWRKLMREGCGEALRADGPVVGDAGVRRWKTESASSSDGSAARLWRWRFSTRSWPERDQKTELAHAPVADGRFAVKAVADTLDGTCSNLAERARGDRRSRGRYGKTDDPDIAAAVRVLVDERSTYGYRRIKALLNRQCLDRGLPRLNYKRLPHHAPAGPAPGAARRATAKPGARRQGRGDALRSQPSAACWPPVLRTSDHPPPGG